MYDLSLHIEYLLLSHDCLVMPGFGAFINVYHAAEFDSERNIWLPPIREIRFNKALRHDDGLLSNSYARKNEVSFEEGRRILSRDIETLKRKLDYEGEVTLGNLGILKNESGIINFIPLVSASRLTRLLGYYDASVGSKVSLLEEKNLEENRDKETESSISEDYKEKKFSFNTERNYYIPVNKIFAKTAACFIVLAAIALAVLIPVTDEKKTDKASVVPVEKIVRSASGIIEKEKDNEIVGHHDDATMAEEIDKESLKSESGLRYHAIVATFNSRAEAEKFIAMKSQTSYTLRIIETPTKKRVTAFDASEREQIKDKILEPEFQDAFGKAWIWEYQEQ